MHAAGAGHTAELECVAIPHLLTSLGHSDMQLRQAALSALTCLAAGPSLRPPVLSALVSACTASGGRDGTSGALDQDTRQLILSKLSSAVLPACSAQNEATSAAAQQAALKLLQSDAEASLSWRPIMLQGSRIMSRIIERARPITAALADFKI